MIRNKTEGHNKDSEKKKKIIKKVKGVSSSSWGLYDIQNQRMVSGAKNLTKRHIGGLAQLAILFTA